LQTHWRVAAANSGERLDEKLSVAANPAYIRPTVSLRSLAFLGLLLLALCALSLGGAQPALAQGGAADDPFGLGDTAYTPSGRPVNKRPQPGQKRAPDQSAVAPIFGAQSGVVNGKKTSAALFQSSLIPIANDDMAEIVNYDCRYPRESSKAGDAVPEGSISKLGQELAGVKDLKGQELKDALIKIKDNPANEDIKDFVFVTDNPKEVYRNLAGTGCELNSRVDGPDVSFTEIFTSPIGFLQDVAVNLGTSPFRSIYNFTAPSAMRYAFFTPHAERGETIYNIIKGGDEYYENGRPLGFNKESISDPAKAEQQPWIRAAIWVRWLLGGFFVLIIVGVGFMYMISRNPRRQRQVLQVLPRLLLATLLMLTIGPLMGWAISASNLVTAELFEISSYNAATCVGNGQGLQEDTLALGQRKQEGCGLLSQLNSRIEYYMNNDVDDEASGSVLAGFDRLILGSLALVSAAIFFFFLLLISVGRQVILVLLVAISPAACFAITFPRTQVWATRWGQAFLVVCLAPAAMALVMFFGLTLAGAAASVPILWFALMLVTFFAIWKIPLMMKGWITGSSGPSATTRVLGTAAKAAPLIPGVGTGVQAALMGAQGASQGSDRVANMGPGALTGGPRALGRGSWSRAGQRRANPEASEALQEALAELGIDDSGRRRGDAAGALGAGAAAGAADAAAGLAMPSAVIGNGMGSLTEDMRGFDAGTVEVDEEAFRRIDQEQEYMHESDRNQGLPKRPERYDLQMRNGRYFVRDRMGDPEYMGLMASWKSDVENTISSGAAGAAPGAGATRPVAKAAVRDAAAARTAQIKSDTAGVFGGSGTQSTGDTTTSTPTPSGSGT